MIIRVSLHSEELLVKMCQTVFFLDWASGVKPSIKLISASTRGMKPQNIASTGFTSTLLFCQTFFKTVLASLAVLEEAETMPNGASDCKSYQRC